MDTIDMIFLFTLLTILVIPAIAALKIWVIDHIYSPRNNEVFKFINQLLDNGNREVSVELLNKYDTMVDYNWIPLKEEYWIGKSYPPLSLNRQFLLTLKYRFFVKWKPEVNNK